MMRSMFSGVAGLRNHQIRMDVIGNNIANVNTIGFKGSRVNFQDILSQTIQGAAAPQNNRGGTNPMQVGLGVAIATIDTIFTDGSTQTTGKQTDLALQGNGFFIINDGAKSYYTRAGNFDFDTAGNYIVPGTGLKVQGWMGDINGVIDVNAPSGDITIPVGVPMLAVPTAAGTFGGSLDSNIALATPVTQAVRVYDSLGTSHLVDVAFVRTATPNTWTWTATPQDPTAIITSATTGTLTFNGDGSWAGGTANLVFNFTTGANNAQAVSLDFSSITQTDVAESALTASADGKESGTLNSVTIDSSGVVTGVFSNGLTRALAQVALASFNNPGGLIKAAENKYEESNNSGVAQVGTANSGGRGKVSPGTLEMSNVDLSAEFTNMIITQRGFQANSKIITTSDEMLQELVNMKR